MRKSLFAALLLSSMLCVPARAGDVEYLSGGCGSGNLATNANPYMTVDSAGRNCTGFYYGYSNITTQTTTTLKTGAGVLHSITFNTSTAGGTVTIFDNTAGSGTKIGTITVATSPQPVTLTYDVAFSTGLTIVTATQNEDITVSFK